MRSLLLALLSIGGAAAQTSLSGGFIVELASAPANKRSLSSHEEFLDALDKRAGGRFHTRQTYTNKLFNGLAVRFDRPEDLTDLASLPNVISVHPIVVHPGPSPSVKVVPAQRTAANSTLGQSPHIMTGVDRVHAAGVTGSGVKIAMIDSGVDYTHPALGGGLGSGFKIAKGYDFVGDDYDGQNTPVPDEDPQDCVGHGTHVAGIIGANPGNEYGVSGVAPDATLFSYKVGGCRGGIGDDVIIAAILRAQQDGADIITLSLGSANGWPSSALDVVASRVVDQGIVVTVSSGNEGAAGPFFASTPASGKGVIAVGSVENTHVQRQTFTSNLDHAPFTYWSLSAGSRPAQPVPGAPNGAFPVLSIYPFKHGVSASDCQELPPDIPQDLSPYIVVVRGTDNMDCPLMETISWRNPAAAVYYDFPWVLSGLDSPGVLLLNDADGFFLDEAYKNGTNPTITFSSGVIDVPVVNEGGLMSYFSSMGPDNELGFKPSISAPGGNITSTYPVAGGSWVLMSGTSMAAPYAAGSAALVLQAKGKGAARNMRGILQSTTQQLPQSHAEGSLIETAAFQGSGLVNIFDAINVKTTVSPAEITLNDTEHWKTHHTLTVRNSGKKPQTYTLSHTSAGTTVTIPEGESDASRWPVALVSNAARVTLGKTKLTVLPGQTGTVVVTIEPPQGLNPATQPIVSGWVKLQSDGGDIVKVPYMGVAGKLSTAQTISTSTMWTNGRDTYPGVIPSDEGRTQTGDRNYTARDPSVWPVFHFALSLPSRHILVDLVDYNTAATSNVPHTAVSKRGWSNWLPETLRKKIKAPPASLADVPTLGVLAEYVDMPRSAVIMYEGKFGDWDVSITQFANGTKIPLGQYKVLLRALRLWGDINNADDHDTYVSYGIGLVP